MTMCAAAAFYGIMWYSSNFKHLNYLEFPEGSIEDVPWKSFFVKWGSWILIFTNFVPISLLVSLEMVKFC